MAIAFGDISAVSTSQTPTSVAVAGSDTVGIVFVAGDSAADNITAATWNGVSMTKIGAVQVPGDRWISAWWVANPASSTTISFTGGSFWRSFSFYYTGAKQTGQPDASATNTSSTTTVISASPTTVAPGSWLIMCQKDVTGGKTYTASQFLKSMRANADAGGIAIGDSNTDVGVGSRTGTMTAAGNSDHGAIAFSLAPATAPTGWVFQNAGGLLRDDAPANPAVFAFDVGSGSDRFLYLGIINSSGQTVSGVTYAGVSMTQQSGSPITDADGNRHTGWYLANPTSGSNNFSVTFSAGTSKFTPVFVVFNGVDQTPTIRSSPTVAGAVQSSIQLDYTSMTANDLMIGQVSGSSASIAGASGTILANQGTAAGAGIGYKNATGATGSTNFTFTNDWWAGMGIAVAPSGASGPVNLKSLDTNVKANIKSYNTNVLANIKSINTNA